MPNDLIVLLLVVAAVCLGVALRDYYDGRPTEIRFRAEDRDRAQPIGKSSASDALTEGWPGTRSVAVKFLDLPYFIRRRSEDKAITRFLRARDRFEVIP